MIKEDCLFCKIVQGKEPSAKFWENDEFIGILDLFPSTKGASLVIPKQHVASDIFNVDFNVVHNGLDSAKICAGMLKNSLNATRVCLVAEGMEIDHMHFKLYPMYSSEDGNYQGLNTKNGPMADPNELEELARRVGGNKN